MYTSRGTRYLMLLSVLEGGLLLLGNFLGAKIWHIGPVIQDGGVLVFPIIYICSDLLVELYGRKVADQAAVYSVVLNTIAVAACTVVGFLPDLPSANNEALGVAFGFSTRVMLASIVGFLLSQVFNNWTFELIWKLSKGTWCGGFWCRSLGSSIGAHIVDSIVFNVIAFAGRVPTEELVQQMFWAVVVGFSIEAILNPITKLLAVRMKRKISENRP